MSYYCGECAVWVGSDDVDKNGRRWCAHSRKYEKSNQQADGCKGFVYNGRTILTKICDILSLPKEEWFSCFDQIKDEWVAPKHMLWLSDYCMIGPAIAEKLEHDSQKEKIALSIYNNVLIPAKELFKKGEYKKAALKYRMMIIDLCQHYSIESV